jgi:Tol biopolymer transport system component
MSLSVGTRFGPYEIVAPLGAGGMGEVYRAHDSRLGREVALKVLPPGFSADQERLRRFEQEARAAGALNHPNILGVYDIGSHDGAPYVVSELLDGETLRARIGDSPLPQRKAVDYAAQIAKGLAAAHERGIVHRDLKPDNLFVTRDGRVKILDFGLAKMGDPRGGDAETRFATGGPETSAGTALGTVGYMSPEQVRGQKVDHRSDIFSFGVVLYEMLTGRRAFQGDSAVETMNAILKEDPKPAGNGGPPLPPGLDRIVLHCLEKSPEERFQSARDVAFDIEALSGTSSQAAMKAPAPGRRSWMRVAAAGLLAAAAGAGLFMAGRSTAPPPQNAVFQPLTFRRGNVTYARFAPDGRTVVYAASWEGAPLELFSTQAGSPESRTIGLQADLQAVSQRGEMAVLLTRPGNSVLARMPIGGGAPREVLEHVQSADWGPDGDSLAVVHTVDGRDRIEFPIGHTLYEAQGWLGDLAVSPKGDRIAFAEHPVAIDNRGDVAMIDLQGKKTTLSPGWEDIFGVHWVPAGDEVWFSASGGGGKSAGTDHAIFAATLSGKIRTVMSAPGSLDLQDLAPDGRVLVAHGNRRPSIMVHTSGAGAEERELTWMDFSWISDISADGRTILFSEQGVAGGPGYASYVRGTDRSPAVRLGKGLSQYLSPDGRWALAIDLTKNKLVILPTGPGESRTVAPHGIKAYSFAAWFPDGKRLVFAGFEEGKGFRMYVQDADGGEPRAVTPEGVAVRSDTLSPDGQWVVAPVKDVLTAFPTGDGKPQPIKGAVAEDIPIRWRGDGRVLFVRQGTLPVRIFALDVTTGQRTLVHEISPRDTVGVNSIGDMRLTPDGNSYAYVYIQNLYSLYQVTGLK